MKPSPSPMLIAALTSVGLAAAIGLAVVVSGTDLVSFITPGRDGPSAAVIEDDFGADVFRGSPTGYDGQQTYAIARFFPDLKAAAGQLDAPLYRMLRIAPPAVASLAPAGEPTIVALLATNVIGVHLTVLGAAHLLARRNEPPTFAPLAALPLLVGIVVSTTGPIAWGLALQGIRHSSAGRHASAASWLAVGVLCREQVVLVAGALWLAVALRERQLRVGPAVLYAAPIALLGLWMIILHDVVGGELPSRFVPLGILDVRGLTLAVALSTFALGVVAAWYWRPEPSVALPCAALSALVPVYSTDILDPLALVRVNALAIGLGLVAIGVIAARREPRRRCS